ncbi:hypothetical protein B0T10DRAFT_464006 [Thelonectria olida]|uniref:Fungal N-terminal domain-containing protein n=1 Tax=Thelonectria olida TaxID=1576542 RepID=A0A9P8VV41_9HYPO|nr:hypothetical protein B0T10DRAFT_464006 [Thelonectria olida]
MIDPISFVALAGNAIQFVEVGSKLVSTFSQLYQSGNGTIAERAELETVIDDLLLLNNMLLTTPGIGKTDPIRRLCEACNEVTRDLLIELERMKVKRKHRFWDALFKALKSSWNEKKIVNLEQRVAILRDELSFHLIVGLRYNLPSCAAAAEC